MLEQRDARVQIKLIASIFPNEGVTAWRNILEERTGVSRTARWVFKWTKQRTGDSVVDRRSESSKCGNPKYNRRDTARIVHYCVGISHRPAADGTRRERHSQRETARWWNSKHRGSKLHQTTVMSMVAVAGFKWRIRPRKCRLTEENRAQRRRFCTVWELASGDEFLNVVFTDSSHLFYHNQPNRHNEGCYVQNGADVPPVTSHKHPQHEHVYGALTQYGLAGPIFVDPGLRIDSKYYREEVLPALVVAIKKMWNDHCEEDAEDEWILQQDGAPAHFAAATMPVTNELLTRSAHCYPGEDDEIDEKMEGEEEEEWPQYWRKKYWPASSADMSPIENVWPLMQAAVSPSGDEPKNREETRSRCTKFFAEFPAAACHKLVHHMPNRVAACIRADYYTTKY